MNTDTKKIIEALGGATSVAKMCEISPQAVYQWIEDDSIPKARLLYFKAIRPDLFKSKRAA